MKNTPFNTSRLDTYLPKKVRLNRLHQIIREVLSPAQREILVAYHFDRLSIPKIAQARGVHKSTVSRTLRRAEENLRQYLKY